jgi:hypothetical protein
MPRSFALGEHFEDFIDAQVTGGRYNNAKSCATHCACWKTGIDSANSNCAGCSTKAVPAASPMSQARQCSTDLKQITKA